MPVIVWGRSATSAASSRSTRVSARRAGRVSATVSTNLGGITTIKAFTAEHGRSSGSATVSQAYREANRDGDPLLRRLRPAHPDGDPRRASPRRCWSAAGWCSTATLEVGLYSVLVYMTQRLLWPLTDLGETLDLYQRAMASTRRIFSPARRRAGDAMPGAARPGPPGAGRFELRDVRFGYADGRRRAPRTRPRGAGRRDPRHRRRHRRRQVDARQAAAAPLRPAGGASCSTASTSAT